MSSVPAGSTSCTRESARCAGSQMSTVGHRSSLLCCDRAAAFSCGRATRCCGRCASHDPDGLLVLEYPYFETDGVHFSEPLSYVDHDEPLASPDIVAFNHGLAQVITSLMAAGMQLTAIEEHDSVPWNPLGDAMEEVGAGEYRLRHDASRLPATYTVQATKVTDPGVDISFS